MKKHNIFKVVLITLLVFVVLSWILPAAYYSTSYVEQGRVQAGLFDLMNYPFTALSYFGYIALFIVLVGGFYGILYKIPAYRTFVEKIAGMFKGKEYLGLGIISVILAFGVSICGLQIPFALFIPLFVSIIFLMGYDKIVAALVIVGSMIAGVIGGTFDYNGLNILVTGLGLDMNYQIYVRFVILILVIILVLFNTFMYIKKNSAKVNLASNDSKRDEDIKEEKIVIEEVKEEKKTTKPKTKTTKSTSKTTKKTTKSSTKSTSSKSSTTKKKSTKSANKAALIDEEVIVLENEEENTFVPKATTESHKIWPIVTLFTILFVIMILAFIPWSNTFGVTLFADFKTAIDEFELFGFPLFAKLFGTFNEFGSWTIVDLLLPLLFVIIILALVYKVKFDDLLDGFVKGAKKAIAPAVVIILLYTILVLVTYHPFQLVIVKAILGLGKGFNILTTILVAILSGLFNFEAAYVYQSSLAYYTSVVTNSANYPLVAIIYQTIYGLTMLVAPTSLVLMAVLSFLKVSYKEWLKNIWKLLVELFVILLIIFIILALI